MLLLWSTLTGWLRSATWHAPCRLLARHSLLLRLAALHCGAAAGLLLLLFIRV